MTKNFKTYALKFLIPRIVAIVVLFGLGISQAFNLYELVVTIHKLETISKNIVYIEQLAETTPSGWDEERTESYDKYISQRNALINDSNSIVAKFAQSNNWQRLCQFIFYFITSLILLYSGTALIPTTISLIWKMIKE